MTTDQVPQVSVIIPVYNAAEYLRECVLSILKQSLQNLEVILINDGSTDNSKIICDEFATSDPRVLAIHINNQGVSNARNVGMQQAKGDYIMFLDSDDWVDSVTCQTAYDFAKQNNLDIVFWSWQKVAPGVMSKETYLERNSSILLENRIDKLCNRSIGLLNEELSDPTKTDAFNTPWAKLYRRALLEDSKVFFIERKKVGMEDVLFNIEIFQHAKRVSYIPAYFNFYRLDNPNSLTKVDTKALYEKLTNLFQAIEKYAVHRDSKMALNNRKIVSLINVSLSITSPKNGMSLTARWNNMQRILKLTNANVSWKDFPIHQLPTHWRLFFQLARQRQTTLLLGLVYLIRIVK